MEPAVLIAIAGLVIKKLTDLAKHLRDAHRRGVVTLAGSFVAGIVAAFVAGANSLLANTTIGNTALHNVSGLGKVLLGLAITSVGASFHDLLAAHDTSDSASTASRLNTDVVRQAPPRGT
ncbi:MAG: hypothetical protein LC792_15020 [Actinobacteria bacterium]|nr:hypothetical protein [Actinomycetota bacterium]